MTLNVTIVFFVLQFGMLFVGIAWWYGTRGVKIASPEPMANYKKTIVKACISYLPVQLILLIFGEPHELTDEIGVITTLLQGALLAFAFYPGSDYRQA